MHTNPARIGWFILINIRNPSRIANIQQLRGFESWLSSCPQAQPLGMRLPKRLFTLNPPIILLYLALVIHLTLLPNGFSN